MTKPSLPFNRNFAEFCQSKDISTGGAWWSKPRGTFNVVNPENSHVWAKAPDGAREEERAAIDAAAATQAGWCGMSGAGWSRPLLQPDG